MSRLRLIRASHLAGSLVLLSALSCTSGAADKDADQAMTPPSGSLPVMTGAAGSTPGAMTPSTSGAPNTPAADMTGTSPSNPGGGDVGSQPAKPGDEPQTPDGEPSETQNDPPPPGEFDCNDLSNLNMDVFPTEDEMWASITKMVDEMGPRHAGSDGDHNWTDYIEQRMKDMGLQNIKRMDTQVLGTNGLSGQGQPTSGTSTHMSGVLPGMSEDVIVIGCHKDGPNSVEENGTVIALEVIDYISKIPMECRKHSFALAFPTCHMASCAQGDVGAWNGMNPEIVQHAIAFLAPEHAGHKRRAPDSTTIQQAFLCTTPGLKAQCEAVLGDIRMEAGESADQWFTTTEALGSSGAWSATTGKPTIGSMSYWDTLAAGLTDTTVKMEGIDEHTFYEVTKFYGRMAGWIDGHADAL